MKLWMVLYAMIWIVLLEFLLAMTPAGPSVTGSLVLAHVVLGVVILGLAWYNFNGLRRTRVPGRVKRIAKSTFTLSCAMVVLGGLLVLDVGADIVVPPVGVSVHGLILFLHVFTAFGIITQAAAVAIAYDRWEDKEFANETEPGLVPAMPVPARPSPPRP